MEVVYIAGPYHSKTVYGILENIRKAEAVALKYWRLGYAVICPHKNTALFDGSCEDSVWLEGDIELLKRSDIVVMMEGWENSSGAVVEYNLAQALGKKIIIERERE
jgi:hypothetical protein